ncbi:MAG: hypothetical protein QOJ04_2477, partial [Caballeronia sp.]|nr:hypothetical protein [Caballeronia sp.]
PEATFALTVVDRPVLAHTEEVLGSVSI